MSDNQPISEPIPGQMDIFDCLEAAESGSDGKRLPLRSKPEEPRTKRIGEPAANPASTQEPPAVPMSVAEVVRIQLDRNHPHAQRHHRPKAQ